MKLILAIVGLMAFARAEETNFYYELPSQSTECFLQHMAERDRTIATSMPIKHEDQIMMMVINPQGRELDRQMGSDELKSDFVVTSAGQHQLCFQNMQNRVVQIYIHIKTGELAESRMQEITRQHLLPVEAQAIRVNEMIQRLRSELSELVKSEVQLSE